MKRPSPRRRRVPRGAAVIVAAAVLAIAALLVRYRWPHAVDGFQVALTPLAVEVAGPGTLDATNRVTVGAAVQGRIAEIAVDVGDAVASGQLLARLESADLANQLAASQASLEAARRSLQMAKWSWEGAAAAEAHAKATRDRKAALTSSNAVSQHDYEAAVASFRQSSADLARAGEAIKQADAEVDVATSNVESLRVRLDDMMMRSPLVGVVVARARNPGDVITPGSSVLELVDPRSIVLAARFDESAIGEIQAGQRARVAFVSQPTVAVRGQVQRLGRTVDTETREFVVDIRLDALPANWALGQRGMAIITTRLLSTVLSVPESLLSRRGGQLGLWVMDGGRARWRSVELGAMGAGMVEVVRGLRVGEVVLAPAGVFPFMRVDAKGVSS